MNIKILMLLKSMGLRLSIHDVKGLMGDPSDNIPELKV